MTMFFEGRELKPYGESVLARDLVVGCVYFWIGYIDADTVLPELEPWVFVGRNLDSQHSGLYFQDAASYLDGVRYSSTMWAEAAPPDEMHAAWQGRECEFHLRPDSEYSGVFEYDKALDQLLACSLRRKTWDGRVRPIQPPVEAEE